MAASDLPVNPADFAERFHAAPEAAACAPGRVNLIGDHTDYHEGFVLPMAINRAIYLQGRRRADRLIRVYSKTIDATIEIDLDNPARHPDRWAQYIQGVVAVMADRQPVTRGSDILIDSDLPLGGGLSSSSALTVGSAALLAHLEGLDLRPLDLAILGRDAEHWYGTTGGIMDQFVISHGRTGHAVLLDCRALSCTYVSLPAGVAVVVANTNHRHDQIASPFAQRRREAEEGLHVVQDHVPGVKTLRDVDLAGLDAQRSAILDADPTGVWWKRCHHAVAENARVVAAGRALQEGDLAAIGTLMAESHASLRDDYEVSSAELDVMVDAARSSPGIIGARMTGGGFGGCTVNLVEREAVDAFCVAISEKYVRAVGIQPTIFTTLPSDGARVRPIR